MRCLSRVVVSAWSEPLASMLRKSSDTFKETIFFTEPIHCDAFRAMVLYVRIVLFCGSMVPLFWCGGLIREKGVYNTLLFRFMYGQPITLHGQIASDVFALAERYRIAPLRELTVKYLERTVTASSVWSRCDEGVVSACAWLRGVTGYDDADCARG